MVLLIEIFMMYAVEMISCGMIDIQNSMKIGRGVGAILGLCLRNLIVSKWWYYLYEGFMNASLK